ncbi:hypothetical protein REJ83_018355 [Clostridioides difficile]|nr:hypothetical protein [Clostridioides difficile]
MENYSNRVAEIVELALELENKKPDVFELMYEILKRANERNKSKQVISKGGLKHE